MKIVITGVTRGLGRALAEYYIKAGHTVIGCGRSGEAIFDLRMAHAAPHDFSVVDVALDTKVAIWAAKVLESESPPDLLINNAAIMNRLAPLWEQDDREFTKLVDANIRGVQNVIRHFVPAMVAAQKGVIVNLSSGWGRSVSPEVAPYCMSKWAIEGLTKALAEELPKGMAAVPLNPGVIDTEMLRSCWADGAANYPKAEAWAEKAAPFILQLGAKDNGRSLSVSGAED
ncbi:MAG: SDR family oxidoreductase [Opitutaceae bacterium]|nr:SDR family oxidoreductase [Opitutaceae bacterium]MBP9913960.1 SDR family oxidoreductase [Opitutaceae bacterium]